MNIRSVAAGSTRTLAEIESTCSAPSRSDPRSGNRTDRIPLLAVTIKPELNIILSGTMFPLRPREDAKGIPEHLDGSLNYNDQQSH